MIYDAIKCQRPFLATRFGSTEGKVCGQILLGSGRVTTLSVRNDAQRNSGIFPLDDYTLHKFSYEYIRSYMQADLVAAWNFSGAVELLASFSAKHLCHLNDLTPFRKLNRGLRYLGSYEYRPWTSALEGKNVLVIHPFEKSIKAQYAKKDQIQSVAEILPDFNLVTLPPPVTFLNYQNDSNNSYFNELEIIRQKILQYDFDVALVSGGAYGLPLSAFIKDLGKPAIHIAGAGQLLFGINGGRWASSEKFVDVIGDNWIYPSQQETPPAVELLQNSYW